MSKLQTKYKTQDPKFWIGSDDYSTPVLVGQSGPVPVDEPLFILRARDLAAVRTLHAYRQFIVDAGADLEHSLAVAKRIKDFESFAANHPDRMKIPDTSMSALHEGNPTNSRKGSVNND